jgi:hypothetical protein
MLSSERGPSLTHWRLGPKQLSVIPNRAESSVRNLLSQTYKTHLASFVRVFR